MIRLLLIRHGENAGDPHELCQPPVDGYLSAAGVEQAERLARAMAGAKIDRVYSSPLGRAIQTAQALPRPDDQPIHILDWLIEWRPSETKDSARYEELTAAANQLPPEQSWKTPAGEGALEMAQRVILGFHELLREFGLEAQRGGFVTTAGEPAMPDDGVRTYALVAHGGSLGRLLSWLIGIPLSPSTPVAFSLTGLAEVTFVERVGTFYPRLTIPAPCPGLD